MKKKYRITYPIPGIDLLPGEYLTDKHQKKINEWLEEGWIVDKTPKEKKNGNRKNESKIR